MSETMLILGAEFGVLVFLIFIMVVFFILRRKRSDKQYVAEFITGYKNSMPARREDYKNRLESTFYIKGKDADALLGKISGTETRMYKRILNLYLGNNRQCLSDIGNEIVSLNEGWLEIMGDSLANASNALGKTEVITQMQQDNAELKKQNLSIREELADAMKSMEEMLKEYALLYAERDEKNETMERLSGEYDEIKARAEGHIDD